MKKKGDTLLQDAIAEAKQVREAAIANARIALEEAFKPHLSSMLSAQLRNEMEDHTPNDAHGTEDGGETDEKAVVEQSELSSSDIGPSDNKQPNSAARTSSNIDNPGQELDTMGQGKQGVDHKIGGRDPAPEGSDAHPDTLHEGEFGHDEDEDNVDLDFDSDDDDDVSMGGPGDSMDGNFGGEDLAGDTDDMGGDMDGGFGDEQGSGNFDIEELIRELEADVLGMTQGAEHPEEEAAFPMTEDESATADAEGHEHTLTFGDGGEKAPEGAPAMVKLSEEEITEQSLEELLREMDVQDQGTNPAHYAKVEELQTENKALKRRLKEHRDVVSFLKDRITEINMLNAKLLFTNKLFKEFNLNGGQKMRVVETFDRATTLREIKLVYTTLVETYAGKGQTGKKTVRQITEGLASKPVASTKPKSTQVLTESGDAQVRRLQQLAGIIKN